MEKKKKKNATTNQEAVRTTGVVQLAARLLRDLRKSTSFAIDPPGLRGATNCGWARLEATLNLARVYVKQLRKVEENLDRRAEP